MLRCMPHLSSHIPDHTFKLARSMNERRYTSTLLALVCPIKLVRCSVDGIEASVESRLSELLQKLLCQHNFVPLLTVLPSHRSDTQVAFSSSFFVQLAQKHPSMFCGLAGRLVQGGGEFVCLFVTSG